MAGVEPWGAGPGASTVHGGTPEGRSYLKTLVPVAILAIVLGVGVFAVHVLGYEYGSMPPEILLRLAHYVTTGAKTIVTALLGLAAVTVVVAGLVMTIIDYLRRLGGALVRLGRYVRDHTLDQLIARTLPWSLLLPALVGFCVLTGGWEAVSYWQVVSIPLALSYGLGRALWSRLRRFLTGGGAAVAVLAGHAAVGVPAFAALADYAPAYLPYTASGWGPYVAMLLGVVVAIGFWRIGSHARDLLDPPPPSPVPPPVDHPATGEYWSPTPIEGWRVWAWKDGALRGYRQPWPASELTAGCDSCREVPAYGHACGIYAVKRRDQVSETFFQHHGYPNRVVGRVEMTGLVIEHERGYRAEKARIVELYAPALLADQIRTRYPDVPVITEEDPWQT